MVGKGLHIAAVVIGRNEGPRLIACLDSLLNCIEHIVYVDSGSSDNSLQDASARGVECIALDLSIPFTAARARNEGAAFLIQKHPDLKYIQFVDGDCEVQPDWVGEAQNCLDNNSKYAVVCGRRRERSPENSIYNQLCDIEWDTPIGDALACGGDALIRVNAFNKVGGYRDDMIAGEEPEMCFRLREQGWKIFRLDEEMTLHDAAITKFSQWWSRAKRAGYAYASSRALHGKSAEKFKVKEVKSILAWGACLPVLVVFLSFSHQAFLLLLCLYPLQILRLFFRFRLFKKSAIVKFSYASSILIAKFPQLMGLTQFVIDQYKGRAAQLIEYK